jgi:hypothetical protein
MVGIIQEQHPDRCALFMQWKQMDWPVMVDSLNLLEVKAVPITVLIDEVGIVRKVRARQDDLAAFLAMPEVDQAPVVPASQPAGPLVNDADAAVMGMSDRGIDHAIETYEHLLKGSPDSGALHFRLGVAYRKRFDSAIRLDGDFLRSIEHWARALEIDPDQYIWRRRIQQYGPRLDKPYSFYDWVHQAREEIRARGEEPLPLTVEPGGAEFAQRAREFLSETGGPEPDPEGRIARDAEGFLSVQTVVVPHTSNTRAMRVHVVLTPNKAIRAHWNNEAEGVVAWVTPPDGWEVDRRRIELTNPAAAVSDEPRTLEFELRGPEENAGATIGMYVLFYACEDVDGECVYRRRDISVRIGEDR